MTSSVNICFLGPDDSPLGVDLRLRPKSATVWEHLRSSRRALPGTVRVVVLRGLSDLAPGTGSDDLQHACDWSSSPAYVSIAILDADVRGPGLDLALGCDLRVVTPSAVLASPGPLSAGRLAATVGYACALDLAVTGRTLSGTEAHTLGLAQRLVPADDLDATVDALVSDLLTPDPDRVRELKALLLGASERGAHAQRAAEAEALARLNSLRAHGAAEG